MKTGLNSVIPLGYMSDILQNLEALAAVGWSQDTRLAGALALVASKQDGPGRWKAGVSV